MCNVKLMSENIDVVTQNLNENPKQPTARRSQEFKLSYGITWNN